MNASKVPYRYMDHIGLILRCFRDVSTEMRAMGVFALLVSLVIAKKGGLGPYIDNA